MSDKQKWKVIHYFAKEKLETTGKFLLVDLNTFFDGNGDEASIASNIIDHPGIRKFHEILQQIELLEGVQGVFIGIIEVLEFATREETEQMAEWPYSDRLCIASSASLSQIEKLIEPLTPDEIYEIDNDDILIEYINIPVLQEGYKWIQVRWD